MPVSIRIPSAGPLYRVKAGLAGSGSRFGMGLILCLYSVLIAFSAVLFIQMHSSVQAVAIAPAKDPNARYYPLITSKRFGFPILRHRVRPDHLFDCIGPMAPIPEADPETLPTVDLALKIPLYPAATSPMPAPTGESHGDAPPAFQVQNTSDREAEVPKEGK